MKIAHTSGKHHYSRLFLKVGSVLFLLFFMLAAPAAPIIAQFGSALFLFFVLLASPAPQPSASPAAIRSDTALQEFAHTVEISSFDEQHFPGDYIYCRSSQQRPHSYAPVSGIGAIYPEKYILHFPWLHTFKTPEDSNCTNSYYITCYYVRAGPWPMA